MIVSAKDGANDDEDARTEKGSECKLLTEGNAQIPKHGHWDGNDGGIGST